ncbi:MAG: protein kinase [Actinomycetota bacterium]
MPKIAGYTINSLIDTGGFSRVYTATQHGLDRAVAVKVLNSTFEDARQQATFERECKLMGQLSAHPNIVTVFASGMADDGRPAIIMELYTGTFRSDETLDIATVVDVGAKVADALQLIHEQRIVHRDIKPHNIFISQHGEPAIGDFGISSLSTERTHTGTAGFSINYAPPEVFEDGNAGAASDIYSLGATLYQLASGEVPFPHTGDPADQMRSTVHKIISAPPPHLRRSDDTDGLDRLLRRCMAKDVADRPASAADVAAELRRIQTDVGRPRPRPSSAPATPQTRPQEATTDKTIARRASSSESVAAIRDRDASHVAEPSDPPAAKPASRRAFIVGGAIAAAVLATSAVVIALGFGSGDENTAAQTTAVQNEAVERDFVVLQPPANLVVEQEQSGAYRISWDSAGDDLKYQVHLVGSNENRFTDDTSYSWTQAGESSSCFEVRTVNAEETRVSQGAAGPECA